ncbi:LysR family transcriptional regulator [Komagataeibacter sp. FNDCF1]|uniref:LysR family transcriptional regulator n=1 Tax=Komagataeibacter sp. FNDCF1 TaxID=2878681 RepID=UPI001E40D1FE|nr:LysR substrate-binding domain-containing protein [Komagataeibacter sp. FNDCF1]MCE2565224.1 LysR family transcriptional regulator [Komagataeibacter sp. FNDCF1]
MKSYRQLPPLRLIIVFHTIAQYRNLSAAARALNVSQPAVSKSLRDLEEYTGTPLFDRARRPLELTAEGDVLLSATQAGLGLIVDGIEEINRRQSQREQTLRISCSIGFATYWLMKRLATFSSQWPSIAVNVLTIAHDKAPDAPYADVMFRYGDGGWTDGKVFGCFRERIDPVASPAFLQRMKVDPGNMAAIPLVHVDVDDVAWRSWEGYFRQIGLPDRSGRHDMRFNNYIQATQAALNGLGIMLGWRSITGDLVAEGRLCPVGLPSIEQEDNAYHIVVPARSRLNPAVQTFMTWIATLPDVDMMNAGYTNACPG